MFKNKVTQTKYSGSNETMANNKLTQTDYSGPYGKFNINNYATKKSVASGLMDAGFLTSSVSQIKALIDIGPDGTGYFWPLIILNGTALVLEIVAGAFLIDLGSRTLVDWKRNSIPISRNNLTLRLTLVILIINIVIDGFRVAT